ASAGAGRHQLEGRAGDPFRGHPAQGLGRQPDLGRCAGASRADVGVADVLAAGAFGPGFPQPTTPGHIGGLGLAPVTCLVPTYTTLKTLSPSPPCWCYALVKHALGGWQTSLASVSS